jgi:hypothetical protein
MFCDFKPLILCIFLLIITINFAYAVADLSPVDKKINCPRNKDFSSYILTPTTELHQEILKKWKNSWESLNHTAYINFYSIRFNNDKKNYLQWNKYKKNIFKNLSHTIGIKINISEVEVFTSPSNNELIIVRFLQDYKSQSHSSQHYKEQLWQKENQQQWRILYENLFNKQKCKSYRIKQSVKQQPSITKDKTFFNKNFFNEQLTKAIFLEKKKDFEQAILLYKKLINMTQAKIVFIARIRLARLYIQNNTLQGNYNKAFQLLNMTKKGAPAEERIFSYYMLAIMYAKGYGVMSDITKAHNYQKKYLKVFTAFNHQPRLKISRLLQDIKLTSPQRLKQKIDKIAATGLNRRIQQVYPKLQPKQQFCQSGNSNPLCYKPTYTPYTVN